MVFIVGTTNFVESLDPALLRPGRFEFHLHIPYPDAEDRREILAHLRRKMGLKMTPEALEYAVKRTRRLRRRGEPGTLFSGDHLERPVPRHRPRSGCARTASEPTRAGGHRRALTEWVERPS